MGNFDEQPWGIPASGVTYDFSYQMRGLQEEDRPREVFDPDVKVKAACRGCNQTWMSDLEGKAKRSLGALIVGESRPPLTSLEQRSVSAWAVLKAMVFEGLSPKTRVIRDDQCAVLRTYQRPPRRFSVRLATCDSRLVFWSQRVIAELETPEGLKARSLCFTLQTGRLVTQVLVDPFDERRPEPLLRPLPGVVSIHPGWGGAVSVDHLSPLDDRGVHLLAHDPYRDAPDASPYFDEFGALRPATRLDARAS